MKNIKAIISLAAAGMVLLSGCTKNFERYNTDQYAMRTEDPSVIIPAMFDPLMYVQQNSSQMADQMVGSLGGYFSLPNRWGGQNYDTFNVSDDWNDDVYNQAFTAIYSNYFKIEDLTEGEGHWFAFAKLLKAAAMMRVVDCYGPIPYSQVRDGEMYVAYDTAEEVYENIIADLMEAAPILYEYQASVGVSPIGSSDPVYSGNYGSWAKLAMSYVMRAAIRSGDSDAFVAAYNSEYGYIETNADNAMMDPKTQGNPYQLASSSWGDLRVSANIVDYMNGYNDPRSSIYFTHPTSGNVNSYQGLRNGQPANFSKNNGAAYSQPNFLASTKLPIFVAAESQFLIAEAILNGWISGDAKAAYENGITLSFEQWGASGASAYIADAESIPGDHNDDIIGSSQNITRSTEVKIAWDAESTEEKHREQIITQKWIANYPMGLEAWAEYRRTGYPELYEAVETAASGATINTIKDYYRLRYPFEERNLNGPNYDAAVSALGGDREDTRLFWTSPTL